MYLLFVLVCFFSGLRCFIYVFEYFILPLICSCALNVFLSALNLFSPLGFGNDVYFGVSGDVLRFRIAQSNRQIFVRRESGKRFRVFAMREQVFCCTGIWKTIPYLWDAIILWREFCANVYIFESWPKQMCLRGIVNFIAVMLLCLFVDFTLLLSLDAWRPMISDSISEMLSLFRNLKMLDFVRILLMMHFLKACHEVICRAFDIKILPAWRLPVMRVYLFLCSLFAYVVRASQNEV